MQHVPEQLSRSTQACGSTSFMRLRMRLLLIEEHQINHALAATLGQRATEYAWPRWATE